MARRELDIMERKIKKAEKKVKKWKGWTAEAREAAEHVHLEVVQIMGAFHALNMALKTLDAQLDDFISAWLAQNGGR
ncbi:hypothetical protein E1A91_A10G162500v1 [Gossypium mustelinum]|uniref:Uncharacterized protein n=5 Tax=Gossypium TaxID=3633 RepID=A0ABR0NF59_GOSAR|nr:hypothetical protein PVK06_034613 [Gossypium arboreum]PPS04559.1 hypothetical protein GOBAR_AA16101 [Gossypium barbadense]TYG99189.1 hypothetical protein ES288_A10G176100v1 [Gossypium darwinii]TYI06674.1 hypothetical protein ES332_A10G175200v1 [Gossypium tomentosum]TYJ15110.1 hypothetical protein E1A91_A10G162500v1 [Gossypium mustelinum]